MDKSGLRTFYKGCTRKLTNKEKETQSQALVKALAAFLAEQKGVWAIFSPMQDEPHLLELLKTSPHIQWCFPLIKGKNEALAFYEMGSLDHMVKSSWGVLEPDPNTDQRVPDSSIQGFLVPGVAFDRNGTRLGRGAGHYDRALENSNGMRIGVTFDSGLAENLTKENHDQPMNIVASPSDWIEISSTEFRKEVSNGY